MRSEHRRRLAAFVIGFVVMAAGAWQRGAVRRPPLVRSGIIVFEDADFGGRSRAFTGDVRDLRASGFNDHISSIVVAAGETWQICADANFGGRCLVVTGSERNFQESGWNDRISSLRRVRDAGSPEFGRGGRDENATLELFAGTNYSGQRKVIDGAVSNFRDIDFNDRTMSVRARGSWEICVGADYDDCRVVTGNVPDLESLGLRRQVSSARPRGFVRGGGLGFPRSARARLVLFDGPDFTGRSVAVDDAQPYLGLFANRARSAQVVGGRWQVCDGPRYEGRCATLTGNVRNLSNVRLDRRIQSARPR